MADKYIKSGTGGTTTPFESWATAATTVAIASGVDAAGETYYISASHNEVSGTAQTIALAGTLSSPNRLICVTDDTTTPPVAQVTTPTGIIGTTGANSITVTGSGYFFGFKINAGAASVSTASLNLSTSDNSNQVFENCLITLGTTSASSRISIGSPSGGVESSVVFKNVFLKFSSSSQGIAIASNGNFKMIGGGIDATSTALNAFIATGIPEQIYVEFSGVDLTALASGASLITSPINGGGDIKFIGCKLPTGWTGVPITTITNGNMRVSLYNCDNSSTNYRLWITSSAGTIRESTSSYKNGGATDGVTSLSWSMVTNSTANYLVNPLVSDPIAIWLDTTGISKTIEIDVLHNSATNLTNADIWLEVDYLGDATAPLLSNVSTERSNLLVAGADHATSSATWTTSLGAPNKQKLSISITPQMKGFVYVRVYLATPSTTVYVDFEPTVS